MFLLGIGCTTVHKVEHKRNPKVVVVERHHGGNPYWDGPKYRVEGHKWNKGHGKKEFRGGDKRFRSDRDGKKMVPNRWFKKDLEKKSPDRSSLRDGRKVFSSAARKDFRIK